jgi:hypothetical protein
MMKKMYGGWSVWKISSETARLHALEAEGKGTFNLAISYCVVGLVKRGGSGGTIVVHVDDGYVGEAEVVKGTLEY